MMGTTTWPRGLWTIFDEMDSLYSDVSRAVSSTGGDRYRRGAGAYPPMNVWSSADGIVLDVELPGIDPKDVDISVLGDQLTLKGRVNAAEPKAGETHHRRERPHGSFDRSLQLPFRANATGVKASYRNGLLRLTIPRHEEEKARKIAVEAA